MSGMEQETGKAGAGGEFAKQATRWATPEASVSKRGDRTEYLKTNTKAGDDLMSQSVRWATPRATDGEKGGPNCRGGRGDPILAGQVCQWPTPVANDDNKTPEAHMAMKARMKGGPRNTITSLQVLVQTWPTPTAQDSEQAGGSGTIQRGMRGHSLNSAVMLASARPTPAARDGKGANSEEHATLTGSGRKHMDQLANFVAYSPLAQPIRDGLTSSSATPSSRRHLNPLFGAWLMGWPSTWVIAEPHASSALATASWRSALRSQLSSFVDEQELHREVA